MSSRSPPCVAYDRRPTALRSLPLQHRIRRNLRVCVSMDPSNHEFTPRCERNPALFTRCSILWLGAWSKPSMRTVASLLLGEISDALSHHLPVDAIVDMLVSVHNSSASAVSAKSPRDFTTLVRTYRGTYVSKVR
jgi:dynein heavy chain 2, cytosolic